MARPQTAPLADTPPPSESEEKAILARIRENALQYRQHIPDFTCTKVTRRNNDQTGTGQQWRLTGTVNEELSYIGRKENYKVVAVNGKKAANADRADSPSSDELGTVLARIFDPKAQAEFKWNNWAMLNNRRTYVFAYGVAQPGSRFMVGGSKMRVAVAFGGLVWADVETGTVMRITAAGQSPANFGIQGVTLDVSYAFTKIGDTPFVLPLKSDFRAKEGKSLIWNEVEFRRCRNPGPDTP